MRLRLDEELKTLILQGVVVGLTVILLLQFGAFNALIRPFARGPVLVTATLGDPKTFNPVTANETSSGEIFGPIFEGLIDINPRTLEFEPRLAELWEFDGSGTVWTFTLRRGVRWNDGAPFTAEDVKFTFDVIYGVPNSMRDILTVDGQEIDVRVVDAYTIEFRLPFPFAPLLSSLPAILPKHVLGKSFANGTFASMWGVNTPPSRIVGTGAYKLVRYVPAQYARYVRNPYYWMKDDEGRQLPYLTERLTLIVKDKNIEYMKFLNGEIDIYGLRESDKYFLEARQASFADGSVVNEIDKRTRAGKTLDISIQNLGLSTGMEFVVFNRNPRTMAKNPKFAWFTDREFLRALAHSIDDEGIIRNLMYGLGEPATSIISPEVRTYYKELPDYGYDLAKARGILEAAGYVDRNGDGIREDRQGNPLAFTLFTNANNSYRVQLATILQNDWKKLGIKVNFKPIDFNTLVRKLVETFDWDVILIGLTGGLEPHNGANVWKSSGMLHMWNPKQESPGTEWEAEIDRLMDEGARELDVSRRREIYGRVQEILYTELPFIMLPRQYAFTAYKNDVKNYRPYIFGTEAAERIWKSTRR